MTTPVTWTMPDGQEWVCDLSTGEVLLVGDEEVSTDPEELWDYIDEQFREPPRQT